MESEHFFLVLLDVEGNIQDHNKLFNSFSDLNRGEALKGAMDSNTEADFSEMLDSILTKPKESQHMLLNLKNSKTGEVTPVWWEFSVIINSEMDLVGLVGIGVGIKFLEQKMPWKNLVDVLNFGKIQLTPEFLIDSVQPKVLNWLGEEAKFVIGESLFKEDLFAVSSSDASAIYKIKNTDEPLCLNVGKFGSLNKQFAAIITKNQKGYLLLLAPTKVSYSANLNQMPISQAQLAAFSGPIWVLNENRLIVQQNHLAGQINKVWKGPKLFEGHYFQLPADTGRNNRLNGLLDKAMSGSAGQLDIRITHSDGSLGFWRFLVNPYSDLKGEISHVILQAVDLSSLYKRLQQLETESQSLKELALRPSHILRSPLSSMMGLLDLIDQRKLDEENQKYFSYLKPLAQELDEVIRSNAKKMSALD